MRPSHVQQYEFLHGCVLTALMRSEQSSTVRLVETDTGQAWATYKVNDAFVHIKPSMTPRRQKKDESRNWQFTFTRSELEKIKDNKSNVVLVCAEPHIKSKEKMWRVLIPFDRMKELVDLEVPPVQDTVIAKHRPNARKIEVRGNGTTVLIAPKALFDWEIPGS